MDLAKEQFANRNYVVAAEIFEQCLRERTTTPLGLDIYFGYGDSLSRVGRLTDAIDVYTHICNQLGTFIPLDKLKHLTLGLLESISQMSRRAQSTNLLSSGGSGAGDNTTVDLLCCPACEEVLKNPVTMPCGHTYCKHCSSMRTQCRVCGALMTSDDRGAHENDVLIKRLVEKWWHPELAAVEAIASAKDCCRRNLLDDALKHCNEALKKG